MDVRVDKKGHKIHRLIAIAFGLPRAEGQGWHKREIGAPFPANSAPPPPSTRSYFFRENHRSGHLLRAKPRRSKSGRSLLRGCDPR